MNNKELKLKCNVPYGVNIRKGPGIFYDIVDVVDHGDEITVNQDEYNTKQTGEYIELIEPKAFAGCFVRKDCFVLAGITLANSEAENNNERKHSKND